MSESTDSKPVAIKDRIIEEINKDGPLTSEELVERIDADEAEIGEARLELWDANRIYSNADWEFDTR